LRVPPALVVYNASPSSFLHLELLKSAT
jgi:hypothetical protein